MSTGFQTLTIDNAILLATVTHLTIPHFLAPVLISAASAVRQRLLIVLFSSSFDKGVSNPVQQWDGVQRLLTFVYAQTTKVAQDLDNVLLDVEVLLIGLNDHLPESIGESMDAAFFVNGGLFPFISVIFLTF